MKTYEQAKQEFDEQIAKAFARINKIKKTKTFDFLCPQCKKVKKILVIRMKQGRQGLKYCSSNCRAAAQRQRDEIRNTTREINNIKSEMHEIKNLLKQLVDIQ